MYVIYANAEQVIIVPENFTPNPADGWLEVGTIVMVNGEWIAASKM